MSKFNKSIWADSDFSKGYRDEADTFLPYRKKFIQTAKLFYMHFLSQNADNKILDLGCGDGFFIQELLKSDDQINAVLVDASQDMLDSAEARLSNYTKIRFIQTSFQELLADDPLTKDFDFIFSSLAIHHLNLHEKKELYRFVHEHLNIGGYFINFDVVLSPTEELEKWYLSIWSEWIKDNGQSTNQEKILNIPQQYKESIDNTPDTLKVQMEALEKIGFQNVDCYFKYGIFSLFGGRR